MRERAWCPSLFLLAYARRSSLIRAETGLSNLSIETVIHSGPSGLPNRTNSLFTTIEGEGGEAFDVIRRPTDAVSAYGQRVDLVLNADISMGNDQEINGKVERLERAIARQP